MLEPRASALARHADAGVRDLAKGLLAEIRLFRTAGESYGYVFYILRKPGRAP